LLGIDSLIAIVQKADDLPQDFLAAAFEFLFSFALRKLLLLQAKVVDGLQAIAARSDDKDDLWRTAVQTAPFENELLADFLVMVIRQNQSRPWQDVREEFYQFDRTRGATTSLFE
jgi:hypothetical protein